MPVLQLSKAEDTYASRRATFGSRFQSPSLGASSVREANKVANNINSLAPILPSVHYYINVSTVILPQFTYYINRLTQLCVGIFFDVVGSINNISTQPQVDQVFYQPGAHHIYRLLLFKMIKITKNTAFKLVVMSVRWSC